MNEKQIEEAARRFDHQNRLVTINAELGSVDIGGYPAKFFTSGANWMQEKIMSEAASGFEEWIKIKAPGRDYGHDWDNLEQEAWQAAKLSSANEIMELKKKAQANIHNSAINGLIFENKELKEKLEMADRLLESYSSMLTENSQKIREQNKEIEQLKQRLEIAVEALKDITTGKKEQDWKSYSEQKAYSALAKISAEKE